MERCCIGSGRKALSNCRIANPGASLGYDTGQVLALKTRSRGTSDHTGDSRQGQDGVREEAWGWVSGGCRLMNGLHLSFQPGSAGIESRVSASLSAPQEPRLAPRLSLPGIPTAAIQRTCGPELCSPSSPMSTSSSGSVSTKAPAGRLSRASAATAASGAWGLPSGLSGPSAALGSS